MKPDAYTSKLSLHSIIFYKVFYQPVKAQHLCNWETKKATYVHSQYTVVSVAALKYSCLTP